MKKTKIITLITLLLIAISANASFSDFEITEVTDTTVSFAWQDEVSTDDTYYLCEEIHNNGNCTEIGADIGDYIQIGLDANTSYEFYLLAQYNSGADETESDSIDINTTHTWEGELLKCVNYAILGSQSTTHKPTKAELEGLNDIFRCIGTEPELTNIDPVVDLINIQRLLLKYNAIASVPADITRLTSLIYLGLDLNNFTEVPSEILTLTQLEELVLSRNAINAVPSMPSPPHLTKLNLSDNALSAIPVGIFTLTNLSELYIGGNSLSVIPTEISALTNLSELNLGGNSLSSIPTEISALINLTNLDLSHNDFSGPIPSEIFTLTSLTNLELGQNSLSSIPTEISALINLTNLDLGYNNFSGSIPTEIFALTNLTNLNLSVNSLSGPIPTEIGALLNMTHLDLTYNALSGKIPQSITNLAFLTADYPNDGNLKLYNNHSLCSNIQSVQDYIDAKGYGQGSEYDDDVFVYGYAYMINSNAEECAKQPISAALIMYLLN